MPRFTLPYGKGTIELTAPNTGFLGSFLPMRDEPPEGVDLIISALDHPIDSPPLEALARPGQSVVILASDLTRPCPNHLLLPPLLDRLNRAGIPDEGITVVIGLGLHRPMTPAELLHSVGEETYQRVRVLNHDVNDVASVGRTQRGTPVEIFRPVLEADLRICTGNVEFHYFAGFSGGAKALIPGVASPATIKANHSHMVQDSATTATLKGNPVREDLEEGAGMVGIDFILNVVVNEKHQVMAAAAGDVTSAHRTLCDWLKTSGVIALPQMVDLAVVSAGGDPKDINLYQAQKALDNIAGVVRPGGILLLLAQCPEGFGSKVFEDWLCSEKTPLQLLEEIQSHFVLGGHKAAAIAMVAQHSQIYLVTEMAAGPLVGIKVFGDPQHALDHAFQVLGPEATYAVFPLGASTLASSKAP